MITPETFERLREMVTAFENCVVEERCGSREERRATEAEARQAREDIDELEAFHRDRR